MNYPVYPIILQSKNIVKRRQTQYIIIYGDEEELARIEIAPETLPEEYDIDISKVKNLKIDFQFPDAVFTDDTLAGIADVVFTAE